LNIFSGGWGADNSQSGGGGGGYGKAPPARGGNAGSFRTRPY